METKKRSAEETFGREAEEEPRKKQKVEAEDEKKGEKKEEEKEEEEEDNFCCPVCFEHFYENIYQCAEGHLICHLCFARMDTCPTCKKDLKMTQIRVRALEKMLPKEIRSCVYECGFKGPLSDHLRHFEKECPKVSMCTDANGPCQFLNNRHARGLIGCEIHQLMELRGNTPELNTRVKYSELLLINYDELKQPNKLILFWQPNPQSYNMSRLEYITNNGPAFPIVEAICTWFELCSKGQRKLPCGCFLTCV
jgi:hypothetical protein